MTRAGRDPPDALATRSRGQGPDQAGNQETARKTMGTFEVDCTSKYAAEHGREATVAGLLSSTPADRGDVH